MVSPGSALPSEFGSGKESVLVAETMAVGGLKDQPGWATVESMGRISLLDSLGLAWSTRRAAADAAGMTGVTSIKKEIKREKKTLVLPERVAGVNDFMS